jgi:hypothetical protein
MVIPGQTIVVWFSCGAASAVAAKRTLDLYGATNTVRIVNTPIAEEDADNRRFLADVERWLGVTIEIATAVKWPASSADEVWRRERFMSSPYGAPCTRSLKKGARQEWEAQNHADWMVLGFTADERDRHDAFTLSERDNVLPVLIDAGLTKGDCFRLLSEAGVDLPRLYRQGYPNANCIGCVKATSPTYWNLVRQEHPEVFDARAALSRELGVRLARHKGQRVFLDELPADAKGRPLKSMDFECGIFCTPERLKRPAA